MLMGMAKMGGGMGLGLTRVLRTGVGMSGMNALGVNNVWDADPNAVFPLFDPNNQIGLPCNSSGCPTSTGPNGVTLVNPWYVKNLPVMGSTAPKAGSQNTWVFPGRVNPDPPGKQYWADPSVMQAHGISVDYLKKLAVTPAQYNGDCLNVGANGNPYVRSDGAVLYYKDWTGRPIPMDPTNPQLYVADAYKALWTANNSGSYAFFPWYLDGTSNDQRGGAAYSNQLIVAHMMGNGPTQGCQGNCCNLPVISGVDYSAPMWLDKDTMEMKLGDWPIPTMGGDGKLHTSQWSADHSFALLAQVQNASGRTKDPAKFIAVANSIMSQPSFDVNNQNSLDWLMNAIGVVANGGSVPAPPPSNPYPASIILPTFSKDNVSYPAGTSASNLTYNAGDPSTWAKPADPRADAANTALSTWQAQQKQLAQTNAANAISQPAVVSQPGVAPATTSLSTYEPDATQTLPLSASPGTPAARLVQTNGSSSTANTSVASSSVSQVDSSGLMNTLQLPSQSAVPNNAAGNAGGFNFSQTGVTDWITANPMLAAGIAIGAFLLLKK